MRYIPCMWQHIAVIIIIKAAHIIYIDHRTASVAEQLHLIVHMHLHKQSDCFILWHRLLMDRLCLLHKLAHTCFRFCHDRICQIDASDTDIIPLSD